jgi:hypothetical protein
MLHGDLNQLSTGSKLGGFAGIETRFEFGFDGGPLASPGCCQRAAHHGTHINAVLK